MYASSTVAFVAKRSDLGAIILIVANGPRMVPAFLKMFMLKVNLPRSKRVWALELRI